MDYLNGTWCFRMPKESSHARMSHVECLFQIMFVELQVQIPHPNPSTACKVPCQTWKLFLWKLFFWDSPRISQILSAFCLLNCLVVADSRFGFPFAWLCCNAWFWCKQLKLSHVRSDHFGLRGLELLMCGQESPYDLRDTVDAGKRREGSLTGQGWTVPCLKISVFK